MKTDRIVPKRNPNKSTAELERLLLAEDFQLYFSIDDNTNTTDLARLFGISPTTMLARLELLQAKNVLELFVRRKASLKNPEVVMFPYRPRKKNAKKPRPASSANLPSHTSPPQSSPSSAYHTPPYKSLSSETHIPPTAQDPYNTSLTEGYQTSNPPDFPDIQTPRPATGGYPRSTSATGGYQIPDAFPPEIPDFHAPTQSTSPPATGGYQIPDAFPPEIPDFYSPTQAPDFHAPTQSTTPPATGGYQIPDAFPPEIPDFYSPEAPPQHSHHYQAPNSPTTRGYPRSTSATGGYQIPDAFPPEIPDFHAPTQSTSPPATGGYQIPDAFPPEIPDFHAPTQAPEDQTPELPPEPPSNEPQAPRLQLFQNNFLPPTPLSRVTTQLPFPPQKKDVNLFLQDLDLSTQTHSTTPRRIQELSKLMDRPHPKQKTRLRDSFINDLNLPPAHTDGFSVSSAEWIPPQESDYGSSPDWDTEEK